MKTIPARILEVRTDDSIPWFQQIRKTVQFPYPSEPQTYYTIKPSDYVTALARIRDGRFLLVRQYRPAVEDYTYELPSGHIEPGETPEEAMARELEEETRGKVGSLQLLGKLVSDTGRLENRLWAFFAPEVEVQAPPVPSENEGIEVHAVSETGLFAMIRKGTLSHALDLSVVALSIIHQHLKP